jgi:hypothetical protein
VIFTPVASPSSTPATTSTAVDGRLTTRASATTSSPTITASLCAPEIRCTATSGQASTSHHARLTSTPVCRARTGRPSAISATPSTESRRSAATVPVSDPPAFAAAAASTTKTGPYGAGESCQVGATASRHGQPRTSTPPEYGSSPVDCCQPWHAYE